MGNISVSLPSDGTSADVSDYNTPLTTIVNAINGGLDNANIASGAAIATSKLAEDEGIGTSRIADGSVTPEKLSTGAGTSWAWQSWTPTWTNLTVGNGTLTAKHTRVGGTVIARLTLVLGSTSSVGTQPEFTLPVTAASYPLTATVVDPVGRVVILDAGTTTFYGSVLMASTTKCRLIVETANATYVSAADITSTVPMTWTTNDGLSVFVIYEAA